MIKFTPINKSSFVERFYLEETLKLLDLFANNRLKEYHRYFLWRNLIRYCKGDIEQIAELNRLTGKLFFPPPYPNCPNPNTKQ